MYSASASPNWVEITALATVLLACGVPPTAWGVWATYRAARDDLAAAREAAQRQIQTSHLPLLNEVPLHGSIYPDMGAYENLDPSQRRLLPVFIVDRNERIDPRAVHVVTDDESVYVSLPVRNVGRGLAVLAFVSPQILGQEHARDAGVDRRYVAPGETARVYSECQVKEPIGDFLRLRVEYNDFVGGQLTEAVFTIGRRKVGEGRRKVGAWVVVEVRTIPMRETSIRTGENKSVWQAEPDWDRYGGPPPDLDLFGPPEREL
jgi:hypothetical protein